MQPHLADGAHQQLTPATTFDRRPNDRHWNVNLVITRYVVVLNLGPAYRAELINEANDGIAVHVREIDQSADVGRAIEVIYRGKRHRAEIRHISRNENGFLVGLQWKNAYAQ